MNKNMNRIIAYIFLFSLEKEERVSMNEWLRPRHYANNWNSIWNKTAVRNVYYIDTYNLLEYNE